MEKNYANVREGRGDNSNEYAIVENRMVPYIVGTIISYFYWICRPPLSLSLSHAFYLVISNKSEKWGTIVLAVKIVAVKKKREIKSVSVEKLTIAKKNASLEAELEVLPQFLNTLTEHIRVFFTYRLTTV